MPEFGEKDWLSSEIEKHIKYAEEIREQNRKEEEEFKQRLEEQRRKIEKASSKYDYYCSDD